MSMVEIDIQLSGDEQVVVCHDPTLERTTNGTGAIGHHTAAQLQQLDAGSWFSPEFSAESIPLLTEVCSLLQARPISILKSSHPLPMKITNIE